MNDKIDHQNIEVGEEIALITVSFNMKDGINITQETDTVRRVFNHTFVGNCRYNYENFFENQEVIEINTLFFSSKFNYSLKLYYYAKMKNADHVKSSLCKLITDFVDREIETLTNDIESLKEINSL